MRRRLQDETAERLRQQEIIRQKIEENAEVFRAFHERQQRRAEEAADRQQSLQDQIRQAELRLAGDNEGARVDAIESRTRDQIEDAIRRGSDEEIKMLKELEQLLIAQVEQDAGGSDSGPGASITSFRAAIDELKDRALGSEDQALRVLDQQLAQDKQRDGILGRIEQIIKTGMVPAAPAVGR